LVAIRNLLLILDDLGFFVIRIWNLN